MTQQIIAETYRTTVPMLQRQRTTLNADGVEEVASPATTRQNQKEFVEALGKQGISAVRKVTNQIFKDYGYVGMFSDDYEQAA